MARSTSALARARSGGTVCALSGMLAALLGSLLLAGCGSARPAGVFNAPAPAPVSADAVVWFPVGDWHLSTQPGIQALKARDGTKAWYTFTGELHTPTEGYPVQVGGTIYTLGDLDSSGHTAVSAVRATDGAPLWQVPLPFTGANAKLLAMATDATTVVVTDHYAGLYALDAATGKVRWHVDRALAGSTIHQIAVGGGVVAALAPRGPESSAANLAHLVVYDEQTGHLLWQGTSDFRWVWLTLGVNSHAVYLASQTDPASLKPPDLKKELPTPPASEMSSAILAYDTHTGTELWSHTMTGAILDVSETTVTLGNVNTGKATSALASLDATTGQLRWTRDGTFDQWYTMSPTPTTLYTDDETHHALYAISMATGKILWTATYPNYLVNSVSQVQGVAAVYLGPPFSLSGPQIPDHMVALDAATGKVYWERDLPA